MMFVRRTLLGGAAALLGWAALATAPATAQDTNYLLATASTGGTYYPVGVALATLTKVKLQPENGIGMSAINSAGSGENVRLLRENEAQFAILQGLFGHYATTGTGPVEADGVQENIRSITMLWQNVEQFVVASENAETGTIEDFLALKGSKAALGRQNSGTIGSNRTILGNLGVDIESDFDLVYAGYGPSAEALQNGQVAGISTPAGVPTGAVTQLFAAMGDGVAMLNFTDEQMATANGDTSLWTRFVIDAGTYPGQEEAVNTIAQPNFLAVNADVPEEHVYLITKTIYENLPFLQAIHPATNAMALDQALAGLPAPLHPGAVKYFREAGIEVPEDLLGP
ncbi:MAG: TAXI family TRAP transporter solute-binding subunit [Geminicoccaceae bacterium]